MQEVNIITLCKDGHHFMFIYPDELESDARRAIAKTAAEKSCGFSWFDAAMLLSKISMHKQGSLSSCTPYASTPAGEVRRRLDRLQEP